MKEFFAFLFVCLLVVGLVFGIMCGVWSYEFNVHVSGRLSRAAHSASANLAEQEMRAALEYIEARGWTKGTTSILFTTPSTDIGFWYENLKEAHRELIATKDDHNPLVQSNQLLKLREVLIRHTKEGTEVRTPSGLYAHPYELVPWVLGVFLLLVCFIFAAIAESNK